MRGPRGRRRSPGSRAAGVVDLIGDVGRDAESSRGTWPVTGDGDVLEFGGRGAGVAKCRDLWKVVSTLKVRITGSRCRASRLRRTRQCAGPDRIDGPVDRTSAVDVGVGPQGARGRPDRSTGGERDAFGSSRYFHNDLTTVAAAAVVSTLKVRVTSAPLPTGRLARTRRWIPSLEMVNWHGRDELGRCRARVVATPGRRRQ